MPESKWEEQGGVRFPKDETKEETFVFDGVEYVVVKHLSLEEALKLIK